MIEEFTNTLYTNDNLFVLNGMNSGLVDLIYLDPPFNTKRIWSAPIGSKAAGTSFKDMWTWDDVNKEYLNTLSEKYVFLTDYIDSVEIIHSKAMAAYLTYMAQRIVEMHRVLKDTGSLYLHCDPTASHYLKIVLDEIFGKDDFRNEIVWCYTGPSGAKRNFPAKHDVILRYTKSDNYVFNIDTIRIPYNQATLERRSYSETKQRGIPFQGKNIKEYEKGKIPSDWWYDIPSGGQISRKERTGYPTQKPLALLQRIIQASSNEGDVVLDPFCGCATTCVAAQQLGRKWIGIDIEKQAVDILIERLSDDAGVFTDFVSTDIIPQRTDLQLVDAKDKNVKERLYKEQDGLCNGCGNQFEIQNLEIDHILPKSKGGGDYYENFQLLCSHCNRVKSNNTMESLRDKIATRKRLLKEKMFFGK